MLITESLSKHFGETKSIHDIKLTIDDGTLVAITGKSGSGKSTLLSLLGGLEKPTEGLIKMNGITTTRLGERSLTTFRRKHIGFVFQSFNLIPNLSALDNVMLPMEFAHVGSRARRVRARNLLEQVGLDIRKQRRLPGKLSGGEQQRVAIARALANSPSFILADEPTGNLDSENGEKIFKILESLSHEQGVTVIIVTHDAALAKRCEVILRLRDGSLIQDTPDFPSE